MQRIAVSRNSFEELRTQNAVYVDKTEHIYHLFRDGGFFFIARPRRFGKSLLCSTLDALFLGKKDLFKGLWIENSDWKWTEHPVLHFDMSEISSATATQKNISEGLIYLLHCHANAHDIAPLSTEQPGLLFNYLIKALHAKTGKKVVVIIDEYDKPMLDVLEGPSDRFNEIRDELKAFYQQLKANDANLQFVFLTGIYKFTQSSIFSGLNNLNDLTFDPAASTLLGYTEDELRQYFAPHIEALSIVHQKNIDGMMDTLRENYNGYRFGVNVSTGTLGVTVYNPFAMGYVFAKQQLLEQWFISGTSPSLITLLKQHNFAEILPENLELGLSDVTAPCSKETMQPLTILFFGGYLTIKDFEVPRKRLFLDFPNAEVATAFSRLLLPELINKRPDQLRVIRDTLWDAFQSQDLSPLRDTFNTILSDLPYFIFELQESYYQTVLYMALKASDLEPIAEEPSRKGRADLVIKTEKTIYIIELKLGQPVEVAIEQIKRKGYAQKYEMDGRDIILVGVELGNKDKSVKAVHSERYHSA